MPQVRSWWMAAGWTPGDPQESPGWHPCPAPHALCPSHPWALWMDVGKPHRRKGVQKWGHFWQKKLTFQPRQGVSNLLGRWGEGLTRKRKINVSPWNFTVTDFNAKKLLSVSCESLMKTNTASQMPSTLCSHGAPQPPHRRLVWLLREGIAWPGLPAPLAPLF